MLFGEIVSRYEIYKQQSTYSSEYTRLVPYTPYRKIMKVRISMY